MRAIGILLVVCSLLLAGPESYATALYRPCPVLFDGSGSGTDDPANREWLLSLASAIVESLPAEAETPVILFDETAISLGIYSRLDSHPLRQDLNANLGTRRWGNPIVGFDKLLEYPDLQCAVVVTDGTVDPPPEFLHFNMALDSAAHELANRHIALIVLARHDSSGEIWRAVAARTGGVYLVDPDPAVLNDTLNRATSQPSPTPISTFAPPPPTPAEADGAGRDAPTQNRGAFDKAPLTIALMGASLLALPVSGLFFAGFVLTRRNPRLVGTVEIISLAEEDHAHQS